MMNVKQILHEIVDLLHQAHLHATIQDTKFFGSGYRIQNLHDKIEDVSESGTDIDSRERQANQHKDDDDKSSDDKDKSSGDGDNKRDDKRFSDSVRPQPSTGPSGSPESNSLLEERTRNAEQAPKVVNPTVDERPKSDYPVSTRQGPQGNPPNNPQRTADQPSDQAQRPGQPISRPSPDDKSGDKPKVG